MSEHKLVPFEPTPEMVEAAEDAYMPFGDMELALRMAILTAPAPVERNQCDGCQAGIPVENGMHRMGKPGRYPDLMLCTADRYSTPQPAAPAVQGEPVEGLSFVYRHPESGETHSVKLSREEVAEQMGQELFEKLTESFCECAPIGETNVVDCRCDEYADEFEMVKAPQPAEQKPACASQSVKSDSQAALSAESERQAPDVSALVEALENIAKLPIDPCSTENDYRLSAAKSTANAALDARRKGGGHDNQ